MKATPAPKVLPAEVLRRAVGDVAELGARDPDNNQWARRHRMGWEFAKTRRDPANGPKECASAAIRDVIVGWAHMAEAHRAMYDSNIGDDGVLGPAWKAIGLSLLISLNGELGRLDGGTLDRMIRNIGDAGGVNFDE